MYEYRTTNHEHRHCGFQQKKSKKLFLCPTDVTKFYKGIRLVGTLNTRGGKNWDFRPKSAFISETVGDRPVARDAT